MWLRDRAQRDAAQSPLVDPAIVEAERQLRLREWELNWTRQFLQAPVMEARWRIILDSMIADPQTGFAAIFRFVHQVPRLVDSVGLHPDSQRRLHVVSDLIRSTISRGSRSLTGTELTHSRMIEGLTNHDRGKMTALYTIRLGDLQRPWGILVSSHLPTVKLDFTESSAPLDLRELGEWMTILGNELARHETVDHQGNELALTKEMLELRAMADLQYRSPSHMLQQFLSRLCEMCGFERGSLFLYEQDEDAHPLSLVRGGIPLPRDLATLWERGEEILSRDTAGASSSSTWGVVELTRVGVMGSFLQAVLLPLVHGQWVMGQLCLTKRTTEPVDDGDRRLVRWATEYLVELLTRTVDRITMEQQATRDGLTLLANRRTFDLELDRIVDQANRAGQVCALVLLDLDHFKNVNDTYGHLGGDAALRTVAHVVERSVQTTRDDDQPIVARYGGEEIAVLLPGVGEPGARRIAESIREAVQRTPIAFEKGDFRITLSAGVSVRGPENVTPRVMIAAADEALYRAKANGRNRVEVGIIADHLSELPTHTPSQ